MSDNILQEMLWLIKEVDWWADVDGRNRVEPTERKGLNREWIERRNSRVFSLAP